jgi:dATP pyrophosphohydrolase
MNENLVQRVAGKAVILADNGILALHPSGIDLNRKWHIPGGIRDDINESIIETAVREVNEETGIDLSKTEGKGIKVGEWKAIDKGEKVKILAVFYLFRLNERQPIKLSHEHDKFAWLDKSNYKQIDANPEVHELVETLL